MAITFYILTSDTGVFASLPTFGIVIIFYFSYFDRCEVDITLWFVFIFVLRLIYNIILFTGAKLSDSKFL